MEDSGSAPAVSICNMKVQDSYVEIGARRVPTGLPRRLMLLTFPSLSLLQPLPLASAAASELQCFRIPPPPSLLPPNNHAG
jgi:hypothetical protein